MVHMYRTEGIEKVYNKIKSKIEPGNPLGYSLSGTIIGIGDGVEKYRVNDRVAASGSNFAYHAEYVEVPENLVVKIPGKLGFTDASTVALGAIALQSVRRANLNLGEFAAVVGVGVIGQLTAQMLKISGIRAAAIDIDEERLKIAHHMGAEISVNSSYEDPIKKIMNWSNGLGVDAVIFSATTTSSHPLSQSFQMCRRKGKVILVGESGMDINREDIYKKELDILMSTSYGPGRYDKKYEEKGLDYPYAYVRWTENRNMSEYLRILNDGLLNLEKLSIKKFHIEKVSDAFNTLNYSKDRPLTIILDYKIKNKNILDQTYYDKKIFLKKNQNKKNILNIGFIGAGNFAVNVHLPNIAKLSKKFQLYAIMDRKGYKGKFIAQKYNAHYVTTNYNDIINDNNVDIVFITTRHDSHAKFALQALEAGKHVFVEKPLAVNQEQLETFNNFFKNINNPPILMVGFNRRFSKYTQEIKKHTDKRINPLFINYRMNAGYLPIDHWAHDDGGRIVGECCHIIDLITFLTKARIKSISYEELTAISQKFINDDNKAIILKYDDGSVATIEYFAVGNKSCSKEYMEVHFDERTIILDDYKLLKGYGVKLKEISSKISRKGHYEELKRLYETINKKQSGWPIELWDILQTTQITLLIQSRF